jgi:nucleoside-diphosphate-sugar epimerase
MKIFIVGGNSSVGKTLLPMLSSFAQVLTGGRTGCDVYLDLSESSEHFNIPENTDVVVNLAARFSGAQFDQINDLLEVNVFGALKVAEACRRKGVEHLIQISSIFALLGSDSPHYSIYSMSKRHAEDLLNLYCRQINLPFTILRPSQIYGEGPVFRKHQPFFYSILDRVERGEEVVLYGNRDASRNYIHVVDVATIISEVAKKRAIGTFNCMSVSNTTYSELASLAIHTFGSSSNVRFDKSKPDILDNTFEIDNTLYELINYYPVISKAVGLERELKYRLASR